MKNQQPGLKKEVASISARTQAHTHIRTHTHVQQLLYIAIEYAVQPMLRRPLHQLLLKVPPRQTLTSCLVLNAFNAVFRLYLSSASFNSLHLLWRLFISIFITAFYLIQPSSALSSLSSLLLLLLIILMVVVPQFQRFFVLSFTCSSHSASHYFYTALSD